MMMVRPKQDDLIRMVEVYWNEVNAESGTGWSRVKAPA